MRPSRTTEWPQRIIVASDGSPVAAAAMVAARELAQRAGASVELLVIHVPTVALPPESTRRGSRRCEAPDRASAARLLQAVHRQRRELLPDPLSWPIRCEVGDPVAVIERVVEETGADLVVLGIGPALPAERHQSGRVAVFSTRQLTVPVYAAAQRCEAPSRCVVVLPNGRAHAPTMRAALATLQPHASVWLAIPERAPGATPIAPDDAREMVLRACGRGMAARLETLDCQVMEIAGDLLTGVLQLVDEVGTQLIAVPVHGMPGPVRTFLPNIAEPLLVTASCSVLVVPDESTGGLPVRGATHD